MPTPFLHSPGQLPDIEGDPLVFTWDQAGADSIVIWGDKVVWREQTGWEVYERFTEIASILQRKYGPRLNDLVPTPGSRWVLFGDSTRASGHVSAARAQLARGGPDVQDRSPLDRGPPNLMQRFLALPAAGKLCVHQVLCAAALEVWLRFAAESQQITYADSVVGLPHTVDLDLPVHAFEAAFDPAQRGRIAELDHAYWEPLAALQDGDFELPDEVEFAYYAIYQAFRKYALAQQVDDWLIFNQALAAQSNPQAQVALLEAALRQAEAG